MSQADGAALRAAIFQNPSDDRARLVYADWLQERGDRYGHFIAAQLRGDHQAAIADLDAAIASSKFPMFEQLTNVPLPRGMTDHMPLELRAFTRGFLSAAAVLEGSSPKLVDEDAWPLIEWFSITRPGADQFVAAVAKRMVSLHSFRCADGSAAEALAHFRPRVLNELHIRLIRNWFELSQLIDENTELDLGLFNLLRAIRRNPKRLELELSWRRADAGGPLERALAAITPKGANVIVSYVSDTSPIFTEVRRVLARMDVKVTERPMLVVG